jgi:hypothetical protein
MVSGSGNVVTEERSVGDFSAVSLQGVGRLIIDETGSESLSITADDNLLPYIETSVRGDKLFISARNGVIFNDVSDLTYHVTAENLRAVELDGTGSIQVSNLDEEKFEVNLSGAGDINVSGKVDEQTIEIDGAGAYTADELPSRDTTVRHDGAGMVVVQVSEKLDVHINGLGTVEYIGDPSVTQEINGLGTVRKR